MLKIINESLDGKSINPERLPKSLRRYAYMIEDFQKSNEYIGDRDWWCYLLDKPEYETYDGTITIHDTISNIRMELKDFEKRNQKN